MRATFAIGSGRALFTLPGGKFYNATKPLEGRILDMTRKEMRTYAAKQGLRLQFDSDHGNVVAVHRKTGQQFFSGPIYELEAKISAGEVL
jgi:hypothetical protein